mmetsp:Transcript_39502/g.35279  ORF Transcript_39502/g.35279 Transcript_39502/m.35279 type:complete len:85 (+) Transcript_39502:68-322(+)
MSSISTIDTQSISPRDLQPLKKLGSSQFDIYLAYSPSLNKQFAMKLYPFHGNHIDQRYINEARYSVLNHENVVKFIQTKDEQRS